MVAQNRCLRTNGLSPDEVGFTNLAIRSVDSRLSHLLSRAQHQHSQIAIYSYFFGLLLNSSCCYSPTAVLMISLMVLSAVTGTLFSVFDLTRGRGVVVATIAPESPFRKIQLRSELEDKPEQTALTAGDTIWRVGGQRSVLSRRLRSRD